MLEARRGLDLHDEPFGAEHGGELGFQDLDRDLAVVLEVLREIDSRHAALTELLLDLVAAVEGGVEALGHVRHECVPALRDRKALPLCRGREPLVQGHEAPIGR